MLQMCIINNVVISGDAGDIKRVSSHITQKRIMEIRRIVTSAATAAVSLCERTLKFDRLSSV